MMSSFLLLLAQQTDPISGGAGWVGAGLLGAVLAWLLWIHLPAKDKQLGEYVASKDKQVSGVLDHLDAVVAKKDTQIDDQRKEFVTTLGAMMSSFKQEATAERQACEKHFGTLADSMNRAFSTLGEQLRTHSERNQQWLDLLKRQIEESKAQLPKGA